MANALIPSQRTQNALMDVAQGASNAAASTVSAPVDAIAWLLRKAGVNVGQPVGGSDWMQRQGLTRPTNSGAGYVGEALGAVAPMMAAAKAPQIANALLKAGDNLANTKRIPMSAQRGAIVFHGSPHYFDGAPSKRYGGVYFSEKPQVSADYAGPDGMVAKFDIDEKALKVFDATQGNVKRFLNKIEKEYDNATDYKDSLGEYMPLHRWFASGRLFDLGRKAQNEIMESIRAEGFDAVRYLDNSMMHDNNTSFVIFDPAKASRIK